MPSGWNPSGRSIRVGSGLAALAGTAMAPSNRTTPSIDAVRRRRRDERVEANDMGHLHVRGAPAQVDACVSDEGTNRLARRFSLATLAALQARGNALAGWKCKA